MRRMRAHWFDIGIVLVVVILEFKGLLWPFLPSNPGLDRIRTFLYKPETKAPVSKVNFDVDKKPVEARMSTIQQIIKNHVTSNKVAIFSKSYCPYCQKAKRLFDELKQPYAAIELDQHEKGAEIQAELLNETGQRTVPNIFINGKHVGGCDKVHELNASSQLKSLLG